MCGRYVLAMRPSQVRRHLEAQHMAVWDAPDDEGDGAPRQSYNFAPGYHGIVYRADTPDSGAGPARDRTGAHGHGHDRDAGDQEVTSQVASGGGFTQSEQGDVKYKLQSMRWGLIPFWTKRNPDYASMMRTINCRDDSLSTPGGMWATMKARKRCVVVAEGFFEWLKVGPKEKLPHYIKRKDGQLMLLAGLWDCVQYEDSDQKLYTYTIITTDSNQQLKFLHDRMPVILEAGSEKLRTWLDPGRHEWSGELQSILRPFDGPLEVYPVSKDVGKVGNNSPSFVIPVNSKENKSNIANFFAKDPAARKPGIGSRASAGTAAKEDATRRKEKSVPERIKTPEETGPIKRKASSPPSAAPSHKKAALQAPSSSPAKPATTTTTTKAKIKATSNDTKTKGPRKQKQDGSQKITKFFARNAS